MSYPIIGAVLLLAGVIVALGARAEGRRNAIKQPTTEHDLVTAWLFGGLVSFLVGSYIATNGTSEDVHISVLSLTPLAFLLITLGTYTCAERYFNGPAYQNRVRRQVQSRRRQRRRIGTPPTRAARPTPRVGR